MSARDFEKRERDRDLPHSSTELGYVYKSATEVASMRMVVKLCSMAKIQNTRFGVLVFMCSSEEGDCWSAPTWAAL